MKLDLIEILNKKAKTKQLHNLYLVEPNGIDETGKTIEWTHKLVQSFIDNSEFPKSILNHSDILILKATEENKLYQKSDIEEIFSFLHYRAQEYHRKIIIIEKAAALSENQVNKLLKTFEEPPVDLSIFLVNASKKQLIATLYSRSIQLKVSLIERSEQLRVQDKIEELSFTDLVQRVDKEQWKISELIMYLHEKLANSEISLASAQLIKETLAELDDAMTYHNSFNSQLFKIYHCLQFTKSS